eukprot:scaffold77907_cov30-Tisochrysis_lutea.AAC.2
MTASARLAPHTKRPARAAVSKPGEGPHGHTEEAAPPLQSGPGSEWMKNGQVCVKSLRAREMVAAPKVV